MSAADDLAAALANVPNVDATIIGIFVSQTGALATVNVGDAQITIPNIGSTVPYPGQAVRLLRIDKQTFLWGPATPGWPIGRVTAFTAPKATVEYPPGSGVTKILGAPTGMTLAVNDYVLIDWTSGGLVAAGPYSAAALPAVSAPGVPGSTTPQSKRQIFYARQTGSFNGSSWNTPDVYDSTGHDGAAFYGDTIASTIPDTATITSVAIYLNPKSTFGFAPQLRLHTQAGMPAGNVTWTATATTLTARSGWVAIPTSFGDLMKAATYGLGFKKSTGGYNVFRSIAEDGLSMALDISYTTA